MYGNQVSHGKTTLWDGVLQWIGNNSQTEHKMYCDIYTLSQADIPYLTRIQWPQVLNMKLFFANDNTVLGPYLISSKVLTFNPNPFQGDFPQVLDSLVADLKAGWVGFVDLTHPQTPRNKQGLILMHILGTNTFTGFVPNCQQTFMLLMQQHQSCPPKPPLRALTEKNTVNTSTNENGGMEVGSSTDSAYTNHSAAAGAVPMQRREPSPAASDPPRGLYKYGNRTSPRRRDQVSEGRPRDVDRNKSDRFHQSDQYKRHRSRSRSPRKSSTDRNNWHSRKSPDRRFISSNKRRSSPIRRHRQNSPFRQNSNDKIISKCDSTNTNNSCDISPSRKSPAVAKLVLPGKLTKTTNNVWHTNRNDSTNSAWRNKVKKPDSASNGSFGQAGLINKKFGSSNYVTNHVQQSSTVVKHAKLELPGDLTKTQNNLCQMNSKDAQNCHNEIKTPNSATNGPIRQDGLINKKDVSINSPKKNLQQLGADFTKIEEIPNKVPKTIIKERIVVIADDETKKKKIKRNHTRTKDDVNVSGTDLNKNEGITDTVAKIKEEIVEIADDETKQKKVKKSQILTENDVKDSGTDLNKNVGITNNVLTTIIKEIADTVAKIKEEIVETADDEMNHNKPEKTQILTENAEKGSDPNFCTSQESSRTAVLECFSCDQLMLSGDIYLCHCRNICSTCIAGLSEDSAVDCNKCGAAFTKSLALTYFYKRILTLLERPCKNQEWGCLLKVQPGDPHEDSCLFEPVKCIACEAHMTKPVLYPHFVEEHPGKYLVDTNPDVKITSFTLDPVTENHQIYCFLSNTEILKITINKLSSELDEASFVFECATGASSLKKVRFNFTVFETYKSHRFMNLMNPHQIMKVPKPLVEHWHTGFCKVRITVSIPKTAANNLKESNFKFKK